MLTPTRAIAARRAISASAALLHDVGAIAGHRWRRARSGSKRMAARYGEPAGVGGSSSPTSGPTTRVTAARSARSASRTSTCCTRPTSANTTRNASSPRRADPGPSRRAARERLGGRGHGHLHHAFDAGLGETVVNVARSWATARSPSTRRVRPAWPPQRGSESSTTAPTPNPGVMCTSPRSGTSKRSTARMPVDCSPAPVSRWSRTGVGPDASGSAELRRIRRDLERPRRRSRSSRRREGVAVRSLRQQQLDDPDLVCRAATRSATRAARRCSAPTGPPHARQLPHHRHVTG